MNRRLALKYCLVYTAGAALLPACLQQKSKSDLLLSNIKVTPGQEAMLAELCDTIIPTTDTPGAKAVGAHLFALMMVDDCYDPDQQDKFVTGMKQFEELCRQQYNRDFAGLKPDQRQKMLATIDVATNKESDLVSFYNTVKKLTIQSFTGSKYYLTQVHVFEMVPGRYHGCVPLKTAKA